MSSIKDFFGRARARPNISLKSIEFLIPVQCVVVTAALDFSVSLLLKRYWERTIFSDFLALSLFFFALGWLWLWRFKGFPRFADRTVEMQYRETLSVLLLTSMVLGFGGDVFISSFIVLTQIWAIGSKKPSGIEKHIWRIPLILLKKRSLLISTYALPLIVGLLNLRLTEPGNILQIFLVMISCIPLALTYLAVKSPHREKELLVVCISSWIAFSLLVLLRPSMLPMTNWYTDVFFTGSPATKLSVSIIFIGVLWAALSAGIIIPYIDFDRDAQQALFLAFCQGLILFSLVLLTTEVFLLEIPFAQIDQAAEFGFDTHGTGWALAAEKAREIIPRNTVILIFLAALLATYNFLEGYKKIKQRRKTKVGLILKQVLLLFFVSSIFVAVERPLLTLFQSEYYTKVVLGYQPENSYALTQIVDIYNWTEFHANITELQIVEIRIGTDPGFSNPLVQNHLDRSQNKFRFENGSIKKFWADFRLLNNQSESMRDCVCIEVFRGRPVLADPGYLSLASIINTVLFFPSVLLFLYRKWLFAKI